MADAAGRRPTEAEVDAANSLLVKANMADLGETLAFEPETSTAGGKLSAR